MLRAIFAICAITVGCWIILAAAPTAAACTRADYQAHSGDCVQDPTAASSPPPDATALCRDGDYSFSETHAGTCSGHHGVAQWCPCGGASSQVSSVAAMVPAAVPNMRSDAVLGQPCSNKSRYIYIYIYIYIRIRSQRGCTCVRGRCKERHLGSGRDALWGAAS
jgi:hypothetical protein